MKTLTTEVIEEILTTGQVKPKSGKKVKEVETEELEETLNQDDLLTDFSTED